VVGVTDPYGHILGFLEPEQLLFLSSSSSDALTRLSGPGILSLLLLLLSLLLLLLLVMLLPPITAATIFHTPATHKTRNIS
jgi:hypothetical protein